MTLRKELTMPRLPRQINMDEDGLYHLRGQVVGSLPTVRRALDEYRARDHYKRRKHPIPLGVGDLYALREQRSNYVSI